MNWLDCQDCGHVFTDGILAGEALSAVMGTTLPHQDLSSKDFAFLKSLCAKIVYRIANYVSAPAKWLDVGFGNATLLLAAKEGGYDPSGIDLRPDNVAKAQGLGINACVANVSDLREEASYDIISMADLLEHVPYPKEIIRIVNRALKPTGVIFISCPSYDSPEWRTADENYLNPYWGEIEHYHNFSEQRLCSLMEEFGYMLVDRSKSERFIIGMELIFVKCPK